MILARPLLGQGAGTFADAYPMFQGPGQHNLVWLRAHSTYLQAAAELGLPVFAVTLATILFVLAVIAKAVLRRVEPTPAALAALAAGAGLAVQSAIDFSVQIQAVAVTAVALLGAGLGEAVARRGDAGRRDADRPVAKPAPRPVPAVPTRFERVSVTIPTAGTRATAPTSSGGFERVQVTIPTRESAPSTMRRPEPCRRGGASMSLAMSTDGSTWWQRLRDAILRDRARSAPATVQVIGLGDFIDRGPELDARDRGADLGLLRMRRSVYSRQSRADAARLSRRSRGGAGLAPERRRARRCAPMASIWPMPSGTRVDYRETPDGVPGPIAAGACGVLRGACPCRSWSADTSLFMPALAPVCRSISRNRPICSG